MATDGPVLLQFGAKAYKVGVSHFANTQSVRGRGAVGWDVTPDLKGASIDDWAH